MRDYTDIERNGKTEAGSRKGKGTLANPAGIRSEANPAWIAGPAVDGPSLPGFVPSCCTGNEKSVTGREISVQDAKISCRDAKKSYRTGDFVTGSTQNGTGPAAAGDWGILKDELATARFHRVVNNKAGMNTPNDTIVRQQRKKCSVSSIQYLVKPSRFTKHLKVAYTQPLGVSKTLEVSTAQLSNALRTDVRRNSPLGVRGRAGVVATARFHRVANNIDMNEPHDTIVRQQCIQHPAPNSLLFAHGSLLTAGLLTKKYYNPPSRREQGTTKNAHLSILEFMGTGDNKSILFLQSSPWNANVLPLQGEVSRVLGTEECGTVANNSKTAVAYET